MIYTLFFSRLREHTAEQRAEYGERAGGLVALAGSDHPGFLGIKTFTADDGERLSVVRFENEEAQKAWRMDPVHREAQERGRELYYDEYHIVVAEPSREYSWRRESD